MLYICFNCKKEYETKFKPNNPEKPYCSRNCAAMINNKLFKKRKAGYLCSLCAIPVRPRQKHCKECGSKYREQRKIKVLQTTLGELRIRRKTRYSNNVRHHARDAYFKSDKPKTCTGCGWTKFIEIAHLKPIKDFPDSATIAEVNDLSNLLALCPNCHWEHDHFKH